MSLVDLDLRSGDRVWQLKLRVLDAGDPVRARIGLYAHGLGGEVVVTVPEARWRAFTDAVVDGPAALDTAAARIEVDASGAVSVRLEQGADLLEGRFPMVRAKWPVLVRAPERQPPAGTVATLRGAGCVLSIGGGDEWQPIDRSLPLGVSVSAARGRLAVWASQSLWCYGDEVAATAAALSGEAPAGGFVSFSPDEVDVGVRSDVVEVALGEERRDGTAEVRVVGAFAIEDATGAVDALRRMLP